MQLSIKLIVKINHEKNQKFLLILLFLLSYCFPSFSFAETYMCKFKCIYDKDKICSLYYVRINKISFYEDKKNNIFNAIENNDYLLLTRIGFPTDGSLPEYIFVENVLIDKTENYKFKKYGFDNYEQDKTITGRCEIKIN